MKTTFLLLIALWPATSYAKTDPRLAAVKTVWVEAIDELADDQVVATCLAERLERELPLKLAPTRDGADAVLRVSSHIPNSGMRTFLAGFGGTPSAHLYVVLPDGTELWEKNFKGGAESVGSYGGVKDESSVGCSLAGRVIVRLRGELRDARDKAARGR